MAARIAFRAKPMIPQKHASYARGILGALSRDSVDDLVESGLMMVGTKRRQFSLVEA
jgi:hypothetical protein